MSDISDVVGGLLELGQLHRGDLCADREALLEEWSQPYLTTNDGSIYQDLSASRAVCPNTERYFQYRIYSGIEEDSSSSSGGGAAGVYVDDEPVGLVKRWQHQLMLATATVKNPGGGYALVRGCVYQTNKSVFDEDRWTTVDESIGVNHARLIHEEYLKDDLPGSSLESLLGEAERLAQKVRGDTR
jgi:hypothetical protein